jgi:hypothetical protein
MQNSTGIAVSPEAIFQQWAYAENNYGLVGGIAFGACDPGGVLTAAHSQNAAQFAQAYNSYVVTQDLNPFIKNFPQCISYTVNAYNAIVTNSSWASVVEFGNYKVSSDTGSYTGKFYAPNSGIGNSWYRQACGTCAADALGISCPSQPPSDILVTTYPVTTSYNNANGGQLSTQTTAPTSTNANLNNLLTSSVSNVPLTESILAYNNNSASWLITCPTTPNTSNTTLYFSSNPSSFLGGDSCLSSTSSSSALTSFGSSGSLTSNVYDRVFSYQNGGISAASLADLVINPSTITSLDLTTLAANAYAIISIGNAASGIINDSAYSGEVQEAGSNTFVISNNYDTSSYIFSGVPSGQQQGIWTWSARYANLKNLNAGSVTATTGVFGPYTLFQSYERNDPVAGPPYVEVSYWICKYSYKFAPSSKVISINNTNIEIPKQQSLSTTSSSSGYLKMDGLIYSGFTPSTTYASSSSSKLSCAAAMYYGQLHFDPFCKGSWKGYVSSSAVLSYSGAKGTRQANVYVYKDPSSSNKLWAAYIDTSSNYEEGYVTVPNSLSTNTTILPFFLYSASIPVKSTSTTPTTSYMNASFDLYSPNNYLSPNTSLDPFPLDTGSGFFATYNGLLSFYPLSIVALDNNINTSLKNNETNFTLTESVANLKSTVGTSSLTAFKGKAGYYFQGAIHDPVFIGSTPNNHVYVINYSSSSSDLWFSTTNQAYLFTMSLVPSGDYNLSGEQPSVVPSAGDYKTWNAMWAQYWANTLIEQTPDIYINSVYQLSNTKSSYWGLEQEPAGEPKFQDFVPTTVTTDYAGDIFVIGHPTSNFWKRTFGTIPTEIAVINVAQDRIDMGTVNISSVYNSTDTNFAVSPDGKNLYISSPKSGNITIYGFTYAKNPANQLVGVFYPNGQFNLSYSTPQSKLVIGKYLANGGPYQDSSLATYYSSQSTTNWANDTVSYHHPIGMWDYKGMLYVLDDWNITSVNTNILGSIVTGGPSLSAGPDNMNILMLRIFYGNNTEVPINPFPVSDTVGPNALTSNTISTFPPYGWPLSANISTSSSTNTGSGSSISYCVSGCTHTPTDIGQSYAPVGPAISLNNPSFINSSSFGSYMDYNGTFYLLAHTSKNFGTSQYTELLSTQLGIANYTNVDDGANASVTCYINVTSSSSPCDKTYSNQSYWSALTFLRAPIAAAPSAFEYAENQGYYRTYLSAIPSLASIFPTGITQNALNTPTPATSSCSITSNTYNALLAGLSGTATTLTSTKNITLANLTTSLNLGFTYINSSINGYVVVPYVVNYTLNQTWSHDPVKNGTYVTGYLSPAAQQATGADTSKYCNFSYYLPHSKDQPVIVLLPDSFTPVPGLGGKNSPKPAQYCTLKSMTYDSTSGNSTALENCTVYSGADSYLLSKHDPNATIEGGGTYATYSTNDSFFMPNDSDEGLIIPPSLDLQLFSNRLFGEMYVNRSISGNTVYSTPFILNASQSENYGINYVVQGGGTTGGQNPGYVIGNVIPTTGSVLTVPTSNANSLSGNLLQTTGVTPIFGVQSSQSGGKYYYNPSNLESNVPTNFSAIQFLNLSTLTPQLFDEYQGANYYGTLNLNFMNSSSILGYNRLIYTFIDRFNNTIYMPISVDFANTTTINLNLTTQINASNTNQTKINVSGSAGYVSFLNTKVIPLPKGSSIYIYFNKNINYYDPTNSPSSAPANYFQHAQLCAYAANASGTCSLANPLSATTQQNGGTSDANTIDYHPQYSSSGQCATQPNSLLAYPLNTTNCNVFGNYGLPQTSTLSSSPSSYEYCVPTTQTGNGILTSQLGLVGIANVTTSGNFNFSFTACGTGQGVITASYYGWPPPEPFQVRQPPLTSSAPNLSLSNVFSGPNLSHLIFTSSTAGQQSQNTANYLTSNEFGYTNAPQSTALPVNIGSFALPFGDISTLGVIGVIAVVVAVAAYKQGKRQGKKRKANK